MITPGATMRSKLSAGGMLTVAEASRTLRIHSSTLRRWSDQGKVRTYRIGPAQHRRFSREDIGALLMELTEDVRPEVHELIRQ